MRVGGSNSNSNLGLDTQKKWGVVSYVKVRVSNKVVEE